MVTACVLIRGHSFIHHLHKFITGSRKNEYTTKLGILTPEFICKGMVLAVKRLPKYGNMT